MADEGEATETNARSRTSRRQRRGHGKPAAPVALADAAPQDERQLDVATFVAVDKMIGAFARRRFGKAFPALAQTFFKIATPAEVASKELQAAFALWVVYGWKDAEGRRIVDMFAEYGLPLVGEQTRVLAALLRCRFAVFSLRRSEPANKQLRGRDVLRDEPMIILDHAAYEHMHGGDALVSWFFPAGKLWRPLGVATRIPRARVKAVCDALVHFKRGVEAPAQTLRRIADDQPAQVFWTTFRGANMRLDGR